MDKLTYQEIIKRILKEQAQYRSQNNEGMTSQRVFDDEHGHYLFPKKQQGLHISKDKPTTVSMFY
jgi:hypothetical protein